MADGTDTQARPASEGVHLRDATDLGLHLIARCAAPGCDRISPFDPAPWLAEGLGALPLAAFSARLRCVCGARQADIEVHPGSSPQAGHRDLYVFR